MCRGSGLLIRRMVLGFIVIWTCAGLLHAEPRLAHHLSTPIGDTGKKGYHDRLPWAVYYRTKFDWNEKIKELEDFRKEAFLNGVDDLAQFHLFQKQRIQRVRNTNQRVEGLIKTVNRKIPEWANQD